LSGSFFVKIESGLYIMSALAELGRDYEAFA
jgi:hypothetical protein